MNARKFTLLFIVVTLVAIVGSVNAALVAYEDFDYAGAVNFNTVTANNGTGWSGPWATFSAVNGLFTSGTGQSLWFDQSPVLISDGSTHVFSDTNRANSRDWTSAVDLATQDLYLIMLVHMTNDAASEVDFRVQFYDGDGATGNMRANVGVTDNTLFAHVTADGYNPAGAGSASAGLANETTYLLAMKRTGSGIFASLILADGSSSTLATEPVSWQVTDAGNSGVDLRSLLLIANGRNNADEPRPIRIDELRIATDWDSAVYGIIPEPSALALLGLGAIGVVMGRRRG